MGKFTAIMSCGLGGLALFGSGLFKGNALAALVGLPLVALAVWIWVAWNPPADKRRPDEGYGEAVIDGLDVDDTDADDAAGIVAEVVNVAAVAEVVTDVADTALDIGDVIGDAITSIFTDD